MTEFIEVLAKLKPKNGATFHVLDSGDIDFEFAGTVVYQVRSLVLYQGNWFVRNGTTEGYNAGILPSNTTFFQPLNPGRDLGHFETLADLQTAFPAPNPGSIATYGDETNFVKWNQTLEVYDEVSGSGLIEREFWVNSDIDNPSAPNTFKGPYVLEEEPVLPPELASVTYLVSLDGITYTEQADRATLNTWISTNVTTDSTVWQMKISATYNAGKSGEVQVILLMSK